MRYGLSLVGMLLSLPSLAAAQSDWRVAPMAPIDLAVALPEGVPLSAQRQTRYSGDTYQDRLTLNARPVGWQGDVTQIWAHNPDQQEQSLDLNYRRDWTAAHSYTASGLEVSLTPHAGLGVEGGEPTAEAGATLRIGQGLNRLARDGAETFGERARWYVYAAGSKRAVGYNFARDRDGDFNRSGVTHDKGSYLGDASIGVAYRRGPIQTSFGVVYREIEAKGLRGFEGMRDEVPEGLVAFQLSIRPQ